jgi:hypothetical protein
VIVEGETVIFGVPVRLTLTVVLALGGAERLTVKVFEEPSLTWIAFVDVSTVIGGVVIVTVYDWVPRMPPGAHA